MAVGRRDAQWMIVEQAWHERADHEVMSLEGLVDRRWLVDASGDGFEILDVENPWIQVTIPADYVKGMVIEYVTGDPVTHLHADFKLSPFRMRFQL